MDFDYSPRTKELQAKLLAFFDTYIYPNEKAYHDEIEANTAAGRAICGGVLSRKGQSPGAIRGAKPGAPGCPLRLRCSMHTANTSSPFWSSKANRSCTHRLACWRLPGQCNSKVR